MYERTGVLVRKKFREYLVPTIMTSLAMSLASVVDSVIVGNLLGDTALAAVGLSSPLIYCINFIYMLFGIGGMTCASISRGRRDARRADEVFTLTIVFGVAVMLLYVLVVNVFMTPITTALATGDAALARLTADYIRPLLFTGPALMFSSGMALFIRTDGRPKSSAVIVIVANGVNLILDFVLIRFLNSGIAGAGLSTTLGYVAGIFVVIPYLRSRDRTFHFTRPGANRRPLLREIVRTGLPKGLVQITSFARSLILNSIVMLILGSIGMSVMTVCVNVLMISNIFVSGTSDALLPIVGTLYGEEDYFGIRQTVKSAAKVLAAAAAALLVFFLAWPGVVGAWFGLTEAPAQAVLFPALRMFALYLPFNAANMLLQNFYNTTGRTKLASSMAVLDGFVFVVSFALILAASASDLFWLCYACSGAATLLTVLGLASRIRSREHVRGVLLLRERSDTSATADISITATPEQAVGLSEHVIQFCREHGTDERTSNRLGVAVEEMAVATAERAHDRSHPGTIDVFLRVTPSQLTIRFRDDGAFFDPAAHTDQGDRDGISGIEVIQKIAQSMDYARQLGFNTTVLTFARRESVSGG